MSPGADNAGDPVDASSPSRKSKGGKLQVTKRKAGANVMEAATAKILHVDDQEASRYAVTRILRQEGFAVMEGANAAEALRLASECPDLILLDVRLPDMNGFEVCRKLKAQHATSTIPVLLLTSTYGDDESKVKGLDSGADGYLTQPIEPPVLIAYIRALLRARRAEEGLVAAGREWESTFDAIGDSIALLDRDGRVHRSNKTLASLLGKPMTDIIGRTLWELLPGVAEPVTGCPFTRMLKSGQRESKLSCVNEKCFRVTFDPLFDRSANLFGAVHIMRDITEQKRVENALRESEARYRSVAEKLETLVEKKVAELRQAETLALIGRMVASVAHEVRNPLQTIGMGVDALRKRMEEDETNREILEEIGHGLSMLNLIIKELLEYSRPVKLQYGHCALRDIVQEALKALAEKNRKIAVELELEDENREVLVDGEMLKRVLINILSNAADAMPHGGTLRISSRFPVEGGKKVLRLEIADTGCGIKEEDLRYIYQPFFTTKQQGTGLGISICRKIIDAHKGEMKVKSELNKGTTVEIKIPVG